MHEYGVTADSPVKYHSRSLRGSDEGARFHDHSSNTRFLSLNLWIPTRKLSKKNPHGIDDEMDESSPAAELVGETPASGEEFSLDNLSDEEPQPGDVQPYGGKDIVVGGSSSTQPTESGEAATSEVTEASGPEEGVAENESSSDANDTKDAGDEGENPNSKGANNGGAKPSDQINDDQLWDDDEKKNPSGNSKNDDLWTDDFAPKDGGDSTQTSSDIVTTEELAEEERKVRFLSTSGALFAILAMIFTAYQMSENPDGIYAAMCRLCITIFGLIFRIILSPCKGLFGHSSRSSHYGHVPVSTMDYGYRDPSVELQLQ